MRPIATSARRCAAVQTQDFGLAAAGQRTKLVYPPGGVVHDSIELYNRTRAPMTVTLGVVAANRSSTGNFVFGAAGSGLAARVHLAADHVQLAPLQRRLVGVTVDRPRSLSAPSYAAITAVRVPQATSGISVQERLALLVAVDGSTTSHAGAGAHSGSGDAGRTLAVVVAVLAALIAAGAWTYRRRRA